ncbi:MAG TPA: DUF5703 family protein [Nocardioidaceae bacterium]|jgi:hypothetical protein|nr:DUF5703 family protein [Nocardioidaceae bacterium]
MDFEFRRLVVPRTVARSAVRQMLSAEAEYGGWELDRVRLFTDGTRRVVLRRRIMRVRSTL